MAVATFTALLSSRAELLNWSMLPALIALSFLGGLLAYAILIGVVGAQRVRTLYQRHELTDHPVVRRDVYRFCHQRAGACAAGV